MNEQHTTEQAPTTIGAGSGFDDQAPLNPAQKQTVDQLVAAGAEELPMAVRPGSAPQDLPADAVSLDSAGMVRVGPYTDNLAEQYTTRMDAREDAALDQEAEEVHEAALWEKAAGAAGDLGKGVFVEGPAAVIAGGKDAFNEALDLIDELGDEATNAIGGPAYVPGRGMMWVAPGEWERIEANLRAQGESDDFAGGARAPNATEDKLSTNTGKFIESASQFVTGFLAGGRFLKGWKAASKGGVFVKSMAQGAIADFAAFDGHEARLSDFLAQVAPDKAQPIFEFLASDQEDPELVGRAKNALEGMGLGVATEAVFKGIRYVRASRIARKAAQREAAEQGFQVDPTIAAAKEAELSAEVVAEANKMLKPNFRAKIEEADETTGKGAKQTGKAVRLATVEPNVFDIDFSKIDTPEKIHGVISTMAERYAGKVDEARGGVQTWASTKEKAARVDWVSNMAARRPGQAQNAAEITAYREALNASATRLLQLADEVRVRPTVAAQYAFRKMLATHHAIQLEFMGARAEAGRALNAFKIPVGAPERSLRMIDALLRESGGIESVEALSEAVLRAAKHGDTALNELIRTSWAARSRGLIKAFYTNSLLSGLGTPIVNVLGNSGALLMNVSSRWTAPRMASVFDAQSETEIGEATALLYGYWGAMRDAFRMAPKEAFDAMTFEAAREKGFVRSLAPGLDDAMPPGITATSREEAGGIGYADAVDRRPFSAAAWRVEEDTGLGRVLDVLQMIIETPSNANALMDDFFKVVAARGELRAQAFRQAQRDLRAGAVDIDGVRARIDELIDNPSPQMLEAAEREMRELTFTRADGGLERKINALRHTLDSRGPIPFGTLLMPFVRTPMNIMSMAMRYSPLAPFMARYSKDIAAGGAQAEIAKAKWATGTAIYAVLLDMAMNGDLTGGGPGNSAQRDAMAREDENGGVSWQPYSVRVGNSWVNFERLDPIGTIMSLVGDFNEIMANGDWDTANDEQMTEIIGHVIGAAGEAFFDKTMLRSMFQTIEAVTSNDSAAAERMLKSRATTLIPFSSASRMFRRGSDEYLRETSGTVDALRNTVPGLSRDLPPQRDLWGNERTYQSGIGRVYDAISPVKVKPDGGNAIDFEILDHGISVAMPNRSLTIDGERVSLKNRPDIYSDYVGLAGKPAFEHLNAVVTGNHPDSDFYLSLSDGPDGEKAEYIRDVIEDYRKRAREEIFEIYGPELYEMAASKQRRREQARMGAN